jgi:hypothetical protein
MKKNRIFNARKLKKRPKFKSLVFGRTWDTIGEILDLDGNLIGNAIMWGHHVYFYYLPEECYYVFDALKPLN